MFKVKAIKLKLFQMENCSAERLALIFTVGLVLGTFPIFGAPTLLCLLAAFVLRLNMAAVQVVNQLASPLQIALLIPFSRIGWHIPTASSASELWKVVALGLQAVTGWLLVCVPLGFLLYYGLVRVLRRRQKIRSAACDTVTSPRVA